MKGSALHAWLKRLSRTAASPGLGPRALRQSAAVADSEPRPLLEPDLEDMQQESQDRAASKGENGAGEGGGAEDDEPGEAVGDEESSEGMAAVETLTHDLDEQAS